MAVHGIYHIGQLTNLPTAGLDLRFIDSVFKYAYIRRLYKYILILCTYINIKAMIIAS